LTYIIPLIAWVYLHSDFFLVGSVKRFFPTRVRFGRSRSSKVIDIGTNRMGVCDFILVRHSNLGPILHRFGAIADFVLVAAPLFLGCSRCTRSPTLGSARG